MSTPKDSSQPASLNYEVVIKAKQRWQLINLDELWKFRELLYIFAWRDIKVRYKQTMLGVAWIVLQPLVNAAIFTIFFGNFAKIPSDSLPYPVFVLLGLIFWGFFSSTLSHAANSFMENENLIKKVYFPREILLFSTVTTTVIDFAITLIVLFILIFSFRVPLQPLFFLMIFVVFFLTVIASTGLGLFLASINIKYRDFKYILPFFLQLLIFVTPVIYPLKIVRPSFQYLLALNPMTGLIDALRSSLAHGTIEHPGILAISVTTALLCFLVGLVYFRFTEKYIADVL